MFGKLKEAAMTKFNLVPAEELENAKQELAAVQGQEGNGKQEFAIVADADGNNYNVEGEMITVGQEFKTGDVEGEGDLVVDASTELEDGSVIVTDGDGVITEIQMAGAPEGEGEGDESEEAPADEETARGENSTAKTEDAKTTVFTEDQLTKIVSDAYAKGAADSAKTILEDEGFQSFMQVFNNAPAAARKTAKVAQQNTYKNSFAQALDGSHQKTKNK